MYTLTHEGDKVGTTKLERGDPTIHAVSGLFDNVGGAKALAGWIKSIGGEEDNGVVFIVLNDAFTLVDHAGNTITFAEGNLIAVPGEDEAFLDITGLSAEDYHTYFAKHVSAMSDDS